MLSTFASVSSVCMWFFRALVCWALSGTAESPSNKAVVNDKHWQESSLFANCYHIKNPAELTSKVIHTCSIFANSVYLWCETLHPQIKLPHGRVLRSFSPLPNISVRWENTPVKWDERTRFDFSWLKLIIIHPNPASFTSAHVGAPLECSSLWPWV